MKIKEKDIIEGIYVIKNTFVETGSNYIEALDSIHKIGYTFTTNKQKEYCMIFMKNGFICKYNDIYKLLDVLNKSGFVIINPISALEYLKSGEIESWSK